MLVFRDFFNVFGVAPLAGRTFRPEESRFGAPPVAVVSQGFWQRQLGADPNISGRRLSIDGTTVEVVGVMPASFGYPADTDIWVLREPVVAELVERHPQHLGRIVAGLDQVGIAERRHREVEHDEVMTLGLVTHPLDPSEEVVDDHPQTGLLDGLAHDSLVQRLEVLDLPAGDRPRARRGTVPAAHEQQAVFVDGEPGSDLRQRRGGRGRCHHVTDRRARSRRRGRRRRSRARRGR